MVPVIVGREGRKEIARIELPKHLAHKVTNGDMALGPFS